MQFWSSKVFCLIAESQNYFIIISLISYNIVFTLCVCVKEHKPSFGDHLMRAAFPSLPDFLSTASVDSSLESSCLLFSRLVVQFAFLLIPLWLYALRLIANLEGGSFLLAFLFGTLGVLGFYFAERIHAAACTDAQRRANKTISAFFIEAGTGIPQEANNLLAIASRCKEIGLFLWWCLLYLS